MKTTATVREAASDWKSVGWKELPEVFAPPTDMGATLVKKGNHVKETKALLKREGFRLDEEQRWFVKSGSPQVYVSYETRGAAFGYTTMCLLRDLNQEALFN